MTGSIADRFDRRVVARPSITWQIATIFGAVLGGFLYVTGTRLPYVAVSVLRLTSAGLILLVPAMYPRRPSGP